MKELLKKLDLKDDTINKILEQMKNDKIYITKEENLEERYRKLKTKKEDIESQLKSSNSMIEDFKNSKSDNENLQNIIMQHEDTIKNLKHDSEVKIRKLTLDTAINEALMKNKVKHAELLLSKFDRDKLVINDDGKVIGLDEQLNKFKETYKDMFGARLKGATPLNPDTKPTKSNNWDYLVNNADNMTAEQIAEAYNNIK
ncbi:phage scaffolding protein [Clostridium oceanicum]|uniref:Phage minor structural protein GP20 n=1 Tax=Clostridium oceanicum TaxID=1543 RepID=A0ABP3UJG5_9CLOT